MNWLDILLFIPLIYAVWVGFRDGVIVQLGGIVAILIGVFLAFKFSTMVSGWLDLNETIGKPLAFLIILIVAIVLIGFGGKLFGKLIDNVGLSMFNKVAGVMFSLLKMSLILSVILMAFGALNDKTKWVEQTTLSKSYLYEPIHGMAEHVFPYLKKMIKE